MSTLADLPRIATGYPAGTQVSGLNTDLMVSREISRKPIGLLAVQKKRLIDTSAYLVRAVDG